MKIIAIIISIFFSSACMADSKTDAYKSLKRIEAGAEIGVTYSEFTSMLKEAKLNTNLYLEEGNNRNSKYGKSISAAMRHYENANKYLSSKNNGDDYISEESDYVSKFYSEYPAAKDNVLILNKQGLSFSEQVAHVKEKTNENSVTAWEKEYNGKTYLTISLDSMLQYALREASNNLKNANMGNKSKKI